LKQQWWQNSSGLLRWGKGAARYTVAMIVMGIDPGLANLGVGIVQEEGRSSRALYYNCFVTSSHVTMPERLLYLHRAVSQIIEIHQPEAVAMEEQFLKKQADTAFKVGQAVGVVQLACAMAGLPVHLYGQGHPQNSHPREQPRRRCPGPSPDPPCQ
jgi:hypothetical protein